MMSWHLQLSKLPQVKNCLAQLSPIFLLLSQNPWIQTQSSSTPALCPQERRAVTTLEDESNPPSDVRCQDRKGGQGAAYLTLAEVPGAEGAQNSDSQTGLGNVKHSGPTLGDPTRVGLSTT